jgi:hypothetical protein
MNLLSSIRQWAFPQEFRINPQDWSMQALSDLDLQQFDQLLPDPSQPLDQMPVALIKEIGTNLWRLKKKLVQPASVQPSEEMRAAYRHMEALWDALAEADIKILDHTGEKMPKIGVVALKVLAYQPNPNITYEQVQETIKPSIYLKQRMIQMGEVIVSKPQGADEK